MIDRAPKNKENPFVQVDQRIALRDDLTGLAKGIMLYALSRPDDWQFTGKEIAKHFVDGRAAIYRAIHELINKGFIRRRRTRDENGMFRGWAYDICQRPKEAGTVSKSKTTESRNTELGKWKFGNTPQETDENPHQLDILTEFQKPKFGKRELVPKLIGQKIITNKKNNNARARACTRTHARDASLSLDISKDEPVRQKKKRRSYPKEFEELWELSRYGSKKKAYQHWRKAIKNNNPSALVDAYKEQTRCREARRKVGLFAAEAPHLWRWLRDERWEEAVRWPTDEEIKLEQPRSRPQQVTDWPVDDMDGAEPEEWMNDDEWEDDEEGNAYIMRVHEQWTFGESRDLTPSEAIWRIKDKGEDIAAKYREYGGHMPALTARIVDAIENDKPLLPICRDFYLKYKDIYPYSDAYKLIHGKVLEHDLSILEREGKELETETEVTVGVGGRTGESRWTYGEGELPRILSLPPERQVPRWLRLAGLPRRMEVYVFHQPFVRILDW